MLNPNFKILFIATLFATSPLIATDETGVLPSDDDSLITPASKMDSSSSLSDDPFSKLMMTLNFLSASNGKIEPWKEAILAFQRASTDSPTLESIREKISSESLTERRISMVEKAFAILSNPITSLSLSAPLPVSSLTLSPAAFTPVTSPAIAPPRSYSLVLSLPSRPFRSARMPAPPPMDNGDLALSGTVVDHTEPVAKRSIPAQVIMAQMSRFIAGQEEALRTLSFLSHRFLCNKLLLESGMQAASTPSHCILTGPTGCGKSESLKQLGIFLDVPIMHVNARSLTDEGYKGQNFSESVSSFAQENGNPVSAIVALDEIDKLGSRGEDDAKNFGKAVQRLLLSPLDGGELSLKGQKFKLANWWFIGTGAFSGSKGLHDTGGERTTTARTHQDIISAGFEPEFVGRFPTVIPFKGHTIDTMMDVISREGSPLRKIQNEFKLFYGVDITIEGAALRGLAKTSIDINLGVRSLNTILSAALQPFYGQAMDLMATEGDKPLVVTLKDIAPAIEQFKRDNKERDPRDDMSEGARNMFM